MLSVGGALKRLVGHAVGLEYVLFGTTVILINKFSQFSPMNSKPIAYLENVVAYMGRHSSSKLERKASAYRKKYYMEKNY